MKTSIVTIAITLAVAAGLSAPALAGGQDGRGYLGVTAVGIHEHHLGETGVFISAVHPGSGAESAGLRKDDRIIDVDGALVASMDELNARLENHRPGDAVWVRVARDGVEQTVNVTLGERPPAAVHFGGSKKWVLELMGGTARLGIRGQTLNPQLARYFEVESGVLVVKVAADSPAARAGIEAGDVLLELEGQPIASVEEIAHRLHQAPAGTAMQATLQRRGRVESLAIDVPEPAPALTAESVKLRFAAGGTWGEQPVPDAELHGDPAGNVVVELFSGGNIERDGADGGDSEALVRRIHELELHLEHLRRQLEQKHGN